MSFDYGKIFTPLFKAAGIEMDSDRPYTDSVKTNSKSKTESTNENELVDVDISASNTGNEEADEAIDKINEQLKTTKEQAEKQKKQYLQQIDTYQQQLKNYDTQIRQYSQTMYGGTGDGAQVANTIMQLSSERNKIYDNINLMLLNIQELEDSLANAQKQAEEAINNIMDQLNSGALDNIASSAASYNPNVGTTSTSSSVTNNAVFANAGSNVINNALKYDDKSESEMAKIMKNAGSRYDPGLWCADFVSHVLKETYGKDNVPGNFLNTCPNTGYCPTIKSWAEGNGSWSKTTNGVQPGDLVLFDWDGDGKPDHVGFYASSNSNGSINTIEGNTSGAGGSSCVEGKQRSSAAVLGYVKLSSLS